MMGLKKVSCPTDERHSAYLFAVTLPTKPEISLHVYQEASMPMVPPIPRAHVIVCAGCAYAAVVDRDKHSDAELREVAEALKTLRRWAMSNALAEAGIPFSPG